MRGRPILKLHEVHSGNLLALLATLQEHPGVSRVELARLAGCNNAVVTRAVQELSVRRLIAESGRTEGGRGRPRTALRLDSDRVRFPGVSLEPECIIAVAADWHGGIRHRLCRQWAERPGRDEYLAELARLTNEILAHCGVYAGPVGLAKFGALSPDGYTSAPIAAFPELAYLDWKEFFQNRFRRPATVGDLSLCRLRRTLGRHPLWRTGTLLWITADFTGIGTALVHDGKVLFENRHGGEFGHNIVIPDGLPCVCGRRGCLEAYAAPRVLLRRARELLNRPDLSWMELVEAYRQTDSALRSAFAPEFRLFGLTLANAINNFPVDTVIISGSLSQLGDDFTAPLTRLLGEILFPAASRRFRLVCESPQPDDGAAGAARLAVEHTLASFANFSAACPAQG